MAVNLTINGQSFSYPEPGDSDWGQNATEWAVAVTNGMLQKAGGNFTLLSDVNFGATYGLSSKYYKSNSTNIAQSGVLRLSNTDLISFRDRDNAGDLTLGFDNNNNFLVKGEIFSPLSSITTIDTPTIDLNFDLSLLRFSSSVKNSSLTDAYIASNANIAVSKLASVTSERALVSDISGKVSPSIVTTSELNRLSGVTSDIQVQFNAIALNFSNYLPLVGGGLYGPLYLSQDPTGSMEAVTKRYVDNLAQGLNSKASCVVATTAAITLSGLQTIDGVSLIAGDRVLVKNQVGGIDNGIYVVSTGTWTRSLDMDVYSEFVGAYIFVSSGTLNQFTGWIFTGPSSGSMAITPKPFTQFSQAGVIQPGAALTLTGNTLDVNVDNSTIEISSNALRLKDGGIDNSKIAHLAGISFNKLQGLSVNKVPIVDSSGFITSSGVTVTELSYLSGVQDFIQFQLNNKLLNNMTTKGDIMVATTTIAGGNPSRLPMGADGTLLTVDNGDVTWKAPAGVATVSSSLTLIAADTGKTLLVDLSSPVSITLPTPALNLKFTFKDSKGLALTNNLTIVRAGSEKIEGVAASKVFQANWGCWTLVSDGTDWFIV